MGKLAVEHNFAISTVLLVEVSLFVLSSWDSLRLGRGLFEGGLVSSIVVCWTLHSPILTTSKRFSRLRMPSVLASTSVSGLLIWGQTTHLVKGLKGTQGLYSDLASCEIFNEPEGMSTTGWASRSTRLSKSHATDQRVCSKAAQAVF
jgi:hypothetical protein